ncbi:MAG: thermonuclease family protein [Hyphomicrobiaceae bacterium]
MRRVYVFLTLVGLVLAGPAIAEIRGKASVISSAIISVNDVRMRLDGVDPPESNQRCDLGNGMQWFCGRSAAAVLFLLVHERDVTCHDRAPRSKDSAFKRVQCYVGGVDVSAEMIRRGMAWAASDAPADYKAAEGAAMAEAVGIFQADTERAQDYRQRSWREAKGALNSDCPIKGNIDSLGRRFYHLPWSQWYALTTIDTGRGERWFCNEAAARDAGWQRAQWNFVPRLAPEDMPKGGVLQNQR